MAREYCCMQLLFREMKIIDARKEHLTYGEAAQIEYNSLKMIKGKWQQTIKVKNKPLPMQRKEAIQYYNEKLFYYFKEQMQTTVKHKESLDQKLSYLMFKNPNAFKAFTKIYEIP